MRLTKEDAEAQRRLIIQSARQVFIRKGYADTTIANIADEAGLSRSPIYYYFNNKANLFYVVLVEHCQAHLNDIRTIFSKSSNIIKLLEEDIQLYLDAFYIERNQLFKDVRLDYPELDKAKEYYSCYRKEVFSLKCEAIERAKQNGELSLQCNAVELVELVFCFYNGLCSLVDEPITFHQNREYYKHLIHVFTTSIKHSYAK